MKELDSNLSPLEEYKGKQPLNLLQMFITQMDPVIIYYTMKHIFK